MGVTQQLEQTRYDERDSQTTDRFELQSDSQRDADLDMPRPAVDLGQGRCKLGCGRTLSSGTVSGPGSMAGDGGRTAHRVGP